MREVEIGDGGRGVEGGVGMRMSVHSATFKGIGSCDGGGVEDLGEGEDFFAFAFLARIGLEVDLGLTFSRNFSFSSYSSFLSQLFEVLLIWIVSPWISIHKFIVLLWGERGLLNGELLRQDLL